MADNGNSLSDCCVNYNNAFKMHTAKQLELKTYYSGDVDNRRHMAEGLCLLLLGLPVMHR